VAAPLHPDRDVVVGVPPFGLPPALGQEVTEVGGRSLAEALRSGFLQVQPLVHDLAVLTHGKRPLGSLEAGESISRGFDGPHPGMMCHR
jgi:hypothetical protein